MTVGPSGGPGPAPPANPEARLRDLLLIGLTFTAGIVDAVSYLGLGQIFTANMTGNLVFLALAVGQGTLFLALRSVTALIGFSLGAIVAGRSLGRAPGAAPWSDQVTRVLLGELVLVACFALGWAIPAGNPGGDLLYALIAVSAFAMGLQNAVARHLAVPGLTTTVITTALTGFMAEFAALGISGPQTRRWAWAILALFGGAAVGGALMLHARSWPPVGMVAMLVGICSIAYFRLGARYSAAPGRTG
jgi:uncharacterized membrane protein YoaK (UPF0700 family)